VRPVLVKSIKVSLYIGVLFDGGVEGETNSDFFVFFFPAIEETSEALSGCISSLSERYELFPSLSSRPFHIVKTHHKKHAFELYFDLRCFVLYFIYLKWRLSCCMWQDCVFLCPRRYFHINCSHLLRK